MQAGQGKQDLKSGAQGGLRPIEPDTPVPPQAGQTTIDEPFVQENPNEPSWKAGLRRVKEGLNKLKP